MIFHEKNFEEKNLVPRDPLRVPRVLILGPARGIFLKLNVPGPLGSVGHSHTSFSTGEFQAAQRTLGSDVAQYTTCATMHARTCPSFSTREYTILHKLHFVFTT